MLAKQTNKSSTDTGQSAANIKHSLWMLATAGQGMAGAAKGRGVVPVKLIEWPCAAANDKKYQGIYPVV
jgi:hypothetical protein